MNHTVSLQIRISDLDSFGHVNNGAQCNLFDYARMQYMETVLNAKINWTHFDLVLVNISIDFRLQIHIHDSIICRTEVYEINNRSMKMRQHLMDAHTETIKTTCHSTLVAVDRERNCSKELPQEYKKRFASFENLSL